MFNFHSSSKISKEQGILKKWLKVNDFDDQQELFPPLQNSICSPVKVSETDIKEFLASTSDDCISSLEDISYSSMSLDSRNENSFCCNDKLEFEDEPTFGSKSEYGNNSSSIPGIANNFTSFSSVNFGTKHAPISEYPSWEADCSATSSHIEDSFGDLPETKASKNFPIKHKKRRKRFKPEQQKLLNTIFSENQYFSSNKSDLAKLAGTFGVPQKTVRVWFQNKRTYWRKKNSNLGFWKSSLKKLEKKEFKRLDMDNHYSQETQHAWKHSTEFKVATHHLNQFENDIQPNF